MGADGDAVVGWLGDDALECIDGFLVLAGAHERLSGAETGLAGERVGGKTLLEAAEDAGGLEVFGDGHFLHRFALEGGVFVGFGLFQQGLGLGFVFGGFFQEMGAEACHGDGEVLGVRVFVGELDVFLGGDVRFLEALVDRGDLVLGFGGVDGFRVAAGDVDEAGERGAVAGFLGFGVLGHFGFLHGEAA